MIGHHLTLPLAFDLSPTHTIRTLRSIATDLRPSPKDRHQGRFTRILAARQYQIEALRRITLAWLTSMAPHLTCRH